MKEGIAHTFLKVKDLMNSGKNSIKDVNMV